MRQPLRLIALLLVLAAVPAAAQTFPSPDYSTVKAHVGVTLPDGTTIKCVGGGASCVASGPGLANEMSRAQTAEGANASAISAETTRAIGSEGTNATAIAGETTRAQGVEVTKLTAAGGDASNANVTITGTPNGSSLSSYLAGLAATANGAIPQSSLGQPGGPASLGSSGTVPLGQIPVTKDATGVARGDVDPIARSAVQPGGAVDTNTATSPLGGSAPLAKWRGETGTPSSMSPPAPEDTQQTTAYGVSSTAGSNVLTINAGIVAADVGKLIAVAGAGSPAAASAVVSAGGTGYAVGEEVTLNIGTCTTQPVLKVTVESGGPLSNTTGAITTVAVKTPGVCSSIPAGAQAQASSTGSGTGASFTLTAGANTLYGTIQAVSGQNVTVSNAAGTTLSNSARVVAWGHDDAPALNALMASAATDIYLPHATYGVCSTVNLPNNRRAHTHGGGADLVALCPMTQVLYQAKTTNFFGSEGSVVEDLTIDGMGLASYDLEHTSASWQYLGITYKNATVANLLCDVQCENTHFEHSNIRNDLSVVPAYPARNIDVEFTDNHFTDIIMSGAINSWVDNGSGTYASSLHAYYASGIMYTLGQSSFDIMLYADSVAANVVAFKIPGTYTNLHGWFATKVSGASGQVGVELVQAAGYNTAVDGTGQGFTSLNEVVPDYGVSPTSTNMAWNNQGAAYQAFGNNASLCAGYQVSCAANSVALGPYAAAAFGGVGIGPGSTAYGGTGSVAMGSGAADNSVPQLAYSSGQIFGQGKNQAGMSVLDAIVTTTSPTRLLIAGASPSGTNPSASATNSPKPNVGGSLKLQCDMVVHSTTSADVAFFQMSAPAILVRGSSGAPTLLSGTGAWTAVSATSGAGTITSGTNSILTPATAVDSTNLTAAISLTASSGSWHAQANCQTAEVD